jgi:hypothetical protein
MPIIHESSYKKPPFYQFNGHLQTILPGMFRKVELRYERERLVLSDGDFVDLDWHAQGKNRLVLLSHGLEGNSERPYMKGMARIFSDNDWDVLAWNCRSCSGEMNRKFRLYNHGEIGDIGEVLAHINRTKNYDEIALIGFSMGGSITLKYLGVHGRNIPGNITKAVAFSTPCDLRAGAKVLDERENSMYKKRFLRKLKAKITAKAAQFPGRLDLSKLDQIEVWRDFDEYFSAPINGYRDADEFYEQSSAKNFMAGASIPTLLVNARNDPILTPSCSPEEICAPHPNIFLETPRQGGHVGFELARKPFMWSEYRALEFCTATHS